MEELSTRKGLNFVYGNYLVDDIRVTCQIDSISYVSALQKLLSKYNITFKSFDKNSYVLFKKKIPLEKTYKSVVIEQNLPSEDVKNPIIEPKIISRLQPVYPAEAVKYNVEGKVTIKLYVNEEGTITNMYISHSSGSAILDSATTNYADNIKFTPALENGKPKNIWVSMTFDYRLINK